MQAWLKQGETSESIAHGVAKSWRRLVTKENNGSSISVFSSFVSSIIIVQGHYGEAGQLFLYHQSLLWNQAWKIYQYFYNYLAEN